MSLLTRKTYSNKLTKENNVVTTIIKTINNNDILTFQEEAKFTE